MTTETTSPPIQRPASAPADLRAIDSKVLLAGRQELSILHGGEAYLLRVTKNGKLLLTK
jgi:hemin uptake protein HemP